ncbi:hypothetical protein ACLM2U_17235 [Bacillus pumilus]
MSQSIYSDSGISKQYKNELAEVSRNYERRQVFLSDGSPGDSLTVAGFGHKHKTIKYILDDGEELDEIISNNSSEGRGSNATTEISDPKKGEAHLAVTSNGGNAEWKL